MTKIESCTDELRLRYEQEAREIDRYDSASFWDRRYHQKRFTLIAARLTPRLTEATRFLDVGCGSGEYVDLAAGIGAHAIGTDLSFGYCRRTSKCGAPNAVQSSALSLPFGTASIDVVLCSEVVEHLPAMQSAHAISELFRVARHWVVITTPNGSASIRNGARRVSPSLVDRLDAEVGHINVKGIRDWERLVRSAKGWKLVISESWHVLPPVLGERFGLPRWLAPTVGCIETVANRILQRSGNCLVMVLERDLEECSQALTDGPSPF